LELFGNQSNNVPILTRNRNKSVTHYRGSILYGEDNLPEKKDLESNSQEPNLAGSSKQLPVPVLGNGKQTLKIFQPKISLTITMPKIRIIQPKISIIIPWMLQW